MNCADFETLLADYLDGTLPATERVAIEAHAASCAGCRQFMNDVRAGFEAVAKAPEIVPPPELITRIAYQAPMGRTRRPFESQSLLSKAISRWVQPMLQPRFAMGMAMTILSFSLMGRCTGIRVQRIESADLNPVKIWQDTENRVVRTKDRAVKYYENIRLVYDIEVRLREMEDQQAASQEEARRRREHPDVKAIEAKPGHGGQEKPAPGGNIK